MTPSTVDRTRRTHPHPQQGRADVDRPQRKQANSRTCAHNNGSTTLENERNTVDSRTCFNVEAIPLRPHLLGVAYRYTRSHIDAEDLVQETYMRAWKYFGTYEAGTNIRAWLVRILVNIWMDSHRKSIRGLQETLAGCLSEEWSAHALTITPSAEEIVLRDQPDEVVKRCFTALPTSFQAAIYYADICQYPLKDVAAIEGIPLGTAMSRRHRGLLRLRAQLNASGLRDAAVTADPHPNPAPPSIR